MEAQGHAVDPLDPSATAYQLGLLLAGQLAGNQLSGEEVRRTQARRVEARRRVMPDGSIEEVLVIEEITREGW